MAEWKKRQIYLNNFHESILELIKKLPKNKYDNVYGLPRGGLIIATYISHHLNIPLLMEPPDINKKGLLKTLIVDDLTDTGESLICYVKKGFETAVIFYKPRSFVTPTYYMYETMDWVVFPYELWDEEENRKPPTEEELKFHKS